MPFRSDQQRKAMHAAAEGRGNISIPPGVARKFIRDSKADGGPMGPPDPRLNNPQYREQYERYAAMDPNQLQQLAVSMPFSTPQGQMIRDLAKEKLMSGPDVELVTGETYAGGGDVRGRSRQRRGDLKVDRSGALQSTIPGRTDHIPMTAPTGSYVVPADVVSGLGEGNSLAGAKIMAEMLKGGPWGPDTSAQMPTGPASPMARGGKTKPVPILAAGGEYVISPQDVRRIGGGNERRGHQVLDKWVVSERGKIVKKMKSLPGPKR